MNIIVNIMFMVILFIHFNAVKEDTLNKDPSKTKAILNKFHGVSVVGKC